MSEWGEAILFGVTVLAFVLGVSSIIMGFMPQPANEGAAKATSSMKEKVEYGFFGFAALVIGILFLVALKW